MVKVLKLTDKNSRHQDLRTTPFTLSFTLSLSPTEDLLLRGSKIGLRPLGGLLLSPKGFPLLRRPLAPPCRVLHGLSFKKQLTTEQGVPLRVTTTCSPWCWTLLLRPGSRTPPPGEKRIDVVRLVGADLIDGELANRLILLPGVYILPFISIFKTSLLS